MVPRAPDRSSACGAMGGGVTTFLTSGPFLVDLASTDPYNTFTRYQRLPDIGVLVPHAQVLTLPSTHRRTLAVLSV